MGKKTRTPDAWEDEDWEIQADRAAKEEPKEVEIPILSRAEREARHAEENRRLWQSA